jgi:hypothetical protein
MTNEIVPPHLVVQAMRDNGYKNAAYAIAELIDNSIQANATIVELLCAERVSKVGQRHRSRIHQVGVLDNGRGMNADVLKIALQFGNGTNLALKDQTGMGKFGMGLPSASISQCTRVEVWSWQNGIQSALYTYLDVNLIKVGKQKTIPEPETKEIPAIWQQIGTSFGKSGTLIVWSDLDRIMWRTAQAIIDNSEFLVGRMYRRFLADNTVTIRLTSFDADNPTGTIDTRNALPNDPGYLMTNTSCPAPFDTTPMFQPWSGEHYEIKPVITFNGENHIVTIRFSVAKEEARPGVNPGSLPHGKHAAKNIGVSIMRAGRELDLDQAWVIQYDPVERWWGVEVEFPPALDELFGVTNNKQAARNFSESRRLDLPSLLQGKTIVEAMDELREDGDPRAQLVEIVHRLDTNIKSMRGWLQQQTRGKRTETKRHTDSSPESVATEATRQRQQEGHQGTSDAGEALPAEQRQHEIEQTLIDEGVPESTAKHLAATTVSDGLKFVFAEADLESFAFFSVKPRGGALVVTLNTSHPAYNHLVEILDREETTTDISRLQERLSRASDGLKLLLSAWARYEDEQRDPKLRDQAKEIRSDWGRMARRFLERDE